MTGRKTIIALGLVFMTGLQGLTGCGSPSSVSGEQTVAEQQETKELVYESSMELSYAENFSVDYYEGGYKVLTTMDGTKILTVPEDQEIPEGIEEDTIILQEPVSNLYLVSSGVMDMFDKIDAIDTLSFSSQKADGWYIEGAKKAMEEGSLVYAGKYSKPDYELLVSGNCSLAIENTMIQHTPKVIEMLSDFDIPTLIEYSSYENEPLGRMEWVKFFGALTGREEEAERIFGEQEQIVEKILQENQADKTGKEQQTVAFFYITSNGLAQVRKSTDYLAKMIEMAGGSYIFDNLTEESSSRSTVSMQLEDFYDGAKDADYLIYNSTIDGGVKSIDELIDKFPLLADFRAVQNGHVWCTTNDMYQQSMSIGYMIRDIHSMLIGANESQMQYLFSLK
ncbi:ABC transporter substrate-binding protein [Hominifimenecus microfluidus]|uniref:ABC transporter substrate-binding protein n=1 Tax=Hominifimenecus microfluidus TaxID=2885348 RepID=UPI0032C0936C